MHSEDVFPMEVFVVYGSKATKKIDFDEYTAVFVINLLAVYPLREAQSIMSKLLRSEPLKYIKS